MQRRLVHHLKALLSPRQRDALAALAQQATAVLRGPMYPYARFVKGPLLRLARRGRRGRRLEIGPGPQRIAGFETLNVAWGWQVDHVADAQRRLPFASGSFELVYASHVLEHMPWYRIEPVLAEWARILEPGGHLELWVPDGLRIARAFVDAEERGALDFEQDGWYRFNERHDPCAWANGRLFSWGDGSGRRGDPNWHLAMFSPRFLRELLQRLGLVEIEQLDRQAVRGYDHGWINLGFRARKP